MFKNTFSYIKKLSVLLVTLCASSMNAKVGSGNIGHAVDQAALIVQLILNPDKGIQGHRTLSPLFDFSTEREESLQLSGKMFKGGSCNPKKKKKQKISTPTIKEESSKEESSKECTIDPIFLADRVFSLPAGSESIKKSKSFRIVMRPTRKDAPVEKQPEVTSDSLIIEQGCRLERKQEPLTLAVSKEKLKEDVVEILNKVKQMHPANALKYVQQKELIFNAADEQRLYKSTCFCLNRKLQ